VEIKTVGIDVGKSWFHLVGCSRAGKPIGRHKLNRGQLAEFVANLPPCLIGIGSMPGFAAPGSRIPEERARCAPHAPKFIKPRLKSQKDDFNDAEAIAEAVSRPTMRFVAVKSNEQLDLQAVHRIRERLVNERTAVTNPPIILLKNNQPITRYLRSRFPD
jgi:transposase